MVADTGNRRPGSRRALDPRRCNIALDANALDYDGTSKDRLVARFRELQEDGVLRVVVPGGVRDEVQHPHTPRYVQEAVTPQIFNLRPGLNSPQLDQRSRVRAILQGNAAPGTHAADASHLSEAEETGCSYFITNDKRILAKRDDLQSVLPPTLSIVTLAEFFDILDDFVSGRLA